MNRPWKIVDRAGRRRTHSYATSWALVGALRVFAGLPDEITKDFVVVGPEGTQEIGNMIATMRTLDRIYDAAEKVIAKGKE